MAVSFSAEALYRWPAMAARAQLASRTFDTIVLSHSLDEQVSIISLHLGRLESAFEIFRGKW